MSLVECRRMALASVLLGCVVCVASAAGASSKAPTISDFAPTSGVAGTKVTISGSGFSGLRAVSVGGIKASYRLVSSTRISATVPTGAKSGRITVSSSHGSGTSRARFTVETTAADGSGTLTTTSAGVAVGSTGNTIVFTFTAAGRLVEGSVHVTVPSGWTAPVTQNAPGCATASAGTLSTGGQTIAVSKLDLSDTETLTITYGATSGGECTSGDGATASTTSGAATWQAEEKSSATGTLTALASSPSISVQPPGGLGMIATSIQAIPPSTPGTTIVFTYTSAGMSDGTLTIAVPSGWTAPVTTNAVGCTTATSGTLTTSGQTITISGLTLAALATDVITYGATSGGSCTSSDGVTTQASTGTADFITEEDSSATGILAPIASGSPSIIVD